MPLPPHITYWHSKIHYSTAHIFGTRTLVPNFKLLVFLFTTHTVIESRQIISLNISWFHLLLLVPMASALIRFLISFVLDQGQSSPRAQCSQPTLAILLPCQTLFLIHTCHCNGLNDGLPKRHFHGPTPRTSEREWWASRTLPQNTEYFKLEGSEQWPVQEGLSDLPFKQVTGSSCENRPSLPCTGTWRTGARRPQEASERTGLAKFSQFSTRSSYSFLSYHISPWLNTLR